MYVCMYVPVCAAQSTSFPFNKAGIARLYGYLLLLSYYYSILLDIYYYYYYCTIWSLVWQ